MEVSICTPTDGTISEAKTREIRIMTDLDDEKQKALIKEAIKEWLDDKLAKVNETVGKWFLRTVAVLLVAALAYFTLMLHGWHR